MTLVERGRRILDEVRRLQPSAQADIFLSESRSRSSEWSEGASENQNAIRSQGMGLRVIDAGRLGFSHTNRFDDEAEKALIERTASGARFTTPDNDLDVPGPSSAQNHEPLELVDSSLTDETWAARAGFLETIEQEVRKRDKRLTKVLRASYREGHSQSSIVNTKGLSVTSEGTGVSFSLACVAVENGETQIGYGFQAARFYADLDIRRVTDMAVDNTLATLGGKQVPSGRYDLLLEPLVAAEMIELFAGALRADQVQKGKSFLGAKQGQRVAAPCIELIDDGRLKRGLGSSPFDGEGGTTQRTVLIHEGILQGFLFDHYTARRGKTQSTGNAGRGSYKGMPGPEASNFFLAPGTMPSDQLLAGVESGLYVRNVMGLHTVDTISGDYSLGIVGQRIENGRLTQAVRGVTIAGNLLELFQNVAAVGSDLHFAGSVGSPTLWIRQVSVGGA